MTTTLLTGLAALVLLAGVGLWAVRRHRSQHTGGTTASASNARDRGDLPDAAGVGIQQMFLPDPSFGWWPISGDLLFEVSRTQTPGYRE